MNLNIVKSKLAPHNKNVLWFDTNNNTLKIYDNGWKSVLKEVVREILNENIASTLITKDDILNSSGTIKSEILPSYVDDILEYDNLNSFPSEGETGKIYLAKDSGWSYRWGGSSYTIVSTGSDVIPTNYETFERLRTTASLLPGKLYRYKFKTKYRENGKDYDDTEEYTIYVRAVANNTVDERIVIHLHPSWEVRYIPKLGSTAVEWSRDDDMGQIIYLKDEHGNSAGFDWKNIKMTNREGNRSKLFSGDNLDIFPFRNVEVQHTNNKLPNSMIYSLSNSKGLVTGLKDTVLYIENSILYIQEDGTSSDDQIIYFTSLNNNVALINSNVTIYDESQSQIIEEAVIKDSIVTIDTLSKVPKIKNSAVSVINSKLSSIENVGTLEKRIYFNGLTNISNTTAEWLFEDGKITNTVGKGYGTGKEDTIKFSANVDFTIDFSTQSKRLIISGYNNYDYADAYLNINGSTYLFPKKNSDGSLIWKSYNITFAATDSISFKFTGNLCCVKFESVQPAVEEEVYNKSEQVQADWAINNTSDPSHIDNRTHYIIGNLLKHTYLGLFECRVISRSDSYAEFCMGVLADSKRTALKDGDKYYVELYDYSTILTYDGDVLYDSKGKIEVYNPYILNGHLMGQLDLRVPELASLVQYNDLLMITIWEYDGVEELSEVYIPTSIKQRINTNTEEIDNVKKEINTTKSDLENLITKVTSIIALSDWDVNAETDNAYIKNRTHYIKNTKIEVKDFTTVLSTQNGAESDNGNATDGNGTGYKQGDYFYISEVTGTDYVPSLEETGLSLGKMYRVILGRNLEYFPDMPDDGYSGANYIIGELKLTEFEGRSIYYIGDLDTAVSPGNLVDGNIYITGHPFILSIVKWGGMSIAGFTDTLSTAVWYNLKYGGEDSIYVDIRIDEVTDYDIEYEYKTLDNGYLNLDSEVSETSGNPVTSAAVYKALLDKITDTYTKLEIDNLLSSITSTLNTEI